MNDLEAILMSRVRAEIFRLLFGLKGERLYLRELTRRSGLAIRAVQRELKHLSDRGLVLSQQDGNRVYHEANTGHPLYEDIRQMVLKTSGLADVLRRALDSGNVLVAFVFGSIAEGKESSESDVDLMVIGDIGLRKTASRLAGVSEQLGREINPLVMTKKEFIRRVKEDEHLVQSILSGSRLFVVGSENELRTVVE